MCSVCNVKCETLFLIKGFCYVSETETFTNDNNGATMGSVIPGRGMTELSTFYLCSKVTNLSKSLVLHSLLFKINFYENNFFTKGYNTTVFITIAAIIRLLQLQINLSNIK